MSFFVSLSSSALNTGPLKLPNSFLIFPPSETLVGVLDKMSSHLKKLFPTLTILVFQSRHFKLNYMLPCNLLNWKLTRSSLSRISISFNQTWKLRAWKLKFPIHFDWKCQFGWDSCEIYAFRRLWHLFVAENCESAFSSPNAFKNMPPV